MIILVQQRMQAAKKDARTAKLEARIVRRDASIRKAAKAARKLAEKDAELSDKDEQIAALNARVAQFEQAAALMTAAIAQPPPASGKKRARKSKSFLFLISHMCNMQDYTSSVTFTISHPAQNNIGLLRMHIKRFSTSLIALLTSDYLMCVQVLRQRLK
jgi:hypothetical protein